MIQNGLEGMFTEVNDKVGTIAGQVGQTPQGWNSGVFNLIQNLSQTVDRAHCRADYYLCSLL